LNFIFNKFKKIFSYKHTIPLRDALCGLSLRIPTLEGDQIPLKIENIVKPGSTHRYKILNFFIKNFLDFGNLLVLEE